MEIIDVKKKAQGFDPRAFFVRGFFQSGLPAFCGVDERGNASYGGGDDGEAGGNGDGGELGGVFCSGFHFNFFGADIREAHGNAGGK